MGVEHSQPLLLTSHRGVAKKAKKSKNGGQQKKADSKIKGGKQKGGQQNKIKNGQLNKSGQQEKKGAANFLKTHRKNFANFGNAKEQIYSSNLFNFTIL